MSGKSILTKLPAGVVKAIATAVVLSSTMISSAAADLFIPSFTYRSGPYSPNGIPYADGFKDYFTLLNERDGGINGQRINLVECEFGYSTEKGLECFEQMADQGALVLQPQSTGLTYKIIPLAAEKGIPVYTMGYGLTAAADGDRFPTVFNFPAHYWHAASAQIRHLKEVAGGSLKGKTIGHVFHNSGYGKEPIPTLEKLAEREGYTLKLFPVDHPGEDQDAVWEQVKAENPDYLLLWGWGIMNEVAIDGALNIDFPLENMIGVWWSANEIDLMPFRRSADGYKAVTFHAVGTEFQIYNDLNMMVYQTGKAAGLMNNLGDVLYNRGMMAAIFTAEALRKAMEIHNTTDLTPDQVRDGFENLEISEETLANIGMDGFVPAVKISCGNHAGAGMVAVKQWDARQREWRQISDYYEPDTALIDPAIEAAAEKFAADNGIKPNDCK